MAGSILFDFKNDPSFPNSGHVTTLPTSQNPHVFASETGNPGWSITASARNYSGVSYSGSGQTLSPAYNTTPSVTLPLTNQLHVPDFSSATVSTASPQAQLTLKNEGTGETGLGMVPDPNNDYEVSPGKTISLDFSALYAQATAANLSITDISFVISSAQVHEGYLLYGSSSSSLAGVPIAGNSTVTLLSAAPGGDSNSTYTVDILAPNLLNDFIFTAYGTGNNNHPNVLLQSVTVGTTTITHHGLPTPEPGSALIWSLVAIVGVAGKHFHRRRAAARIQP
jgi:hypothetical protein